VALEDSCACGLSIRSYSEYIGMFRIAKEQGVGGFFEPLSTLQAIACKVISDLKQALGTGL